MSNPQETLRIPPFAGRQPVTIEVDGEEIQAFAGETVAAALLAMGRRAFRHTERVRAPRGIFCGMGVCFECIVTVDGLPGVRACVTPIRPGMVIDTRGGSDAVIADA